MRLFGTPSQLSSYFGSQLLIIGQEGCFERLVDLDILFAQE